MITHLNSTSTSNNNKIIIKVYGGSETNRQCRAFEVAIKDCRKRFKASYGSNFEFPVVQIIKSLSLNKSQSRALFEWLLDSDIHFILGHPHQGAFSECNVADLYEDIGILNNHLGFPYGPQIQGCPIFTQNKYNYICCVADITIPTFIVSKSYI